MMKKKLHEIEDMRSLTLPALLDPWCKKFGFTTNEKLVNVMRRFKSEMQQLQPCW